MRPVIIREFIHLTFRVPLTPSPIEKIGESQIERS